MKIAWKEHGLLSQNTEACSFCVTNVPVIFYYLAGCCSCENGGLVDTCPLLEFGPSYKQCNPENLSALQTTTKKKLLGLHVYNCDLYAAVYFLVLLSGI